ncbi:MAG: J domain-containing protein [Anaerolineae bacterium]|nr:J domain-containing protein [Anaerolineae bacterium]
MKYPDYYAELGVDRNASPKEIKQAYRRLARQYHPDVNPDDQADEEKLKRINEAHDVLSDPEKRRKYDDLVANYQQWQMRGGSPDGYDWEQWESDQSAGIRYGFTETEFEPEDPLSDFFRAIFGGDTERRQGRRRSSRHTIRGRDMEVEAVISLHDAYFGTTREILSGQQRLNVKIPPGARNGTRVRLRGKGQRGYAGGQAGDLDVIIKLEPHPIFRREGNHLHLDLKVSLYTAVLGGKVTIATLDGDVTLHIQPGTQSGQIIRLREKGMPLLRQASVYGDLYAHVLIQVPDKLSDEERALFERLRILRANPPR